MDVVLVRRSKEHPGSWFPTIARRFAFVRAAIYSGYHCSGFREFGAHPFMY